MSSTISCYLLSTADNSNVPLYVSAELNGTGVHFCSCSVNKPCVFIQTIDAATADKSEGSSGGLDADPFLFLVRPSPISHYYSTPVSLPYFSSPVLKYSYRRFGEFVRRPTLPGEKTAVSCKSWTGPNTLVPRDLQSWRARVPRVPWGRCAYGSDCL